ncbi:unnamed protein product [Fusarium langsethiae]|nr:unnamed protein product [Fusarium langsethiae]
MRHINRRRRIDEERARKYLGTAAIDPSLVNATRNDEGSLSIDPYQYQTPAMIDRSDFHNSLLRAKINVKALKDPEGGVVSLDFDPGTRIQCLQAIPDAFDPSSSTKPKDARCLLKLYSSDLSDEAKTDVIDENSCERQPSDGELFYRLSLHWQTYKDDLDPPDNKWLGILAKKSDSKAIHARRLLNTNNPFTAAFGRFHSIPSMFWGMQLGLVGQMIAMPGRDELLQYLMRIDEFWTQICPTNEAKEKVDVATLEYLTSQAPGADEKQYRALRKAFDENLVFTRLSTGDKNLVWSRLIELTRDRCIPTLQAFFRNIGYLSAVSYSIERLKDSRKVTFEDGFGQGPGKRKRQKKFIEKRKSLKQELTNGFQRNVEGKCLVQTTENAYKLVEAGHIDQCELGYRTLWAFCLRWHPMLPRRATSEHQVLRDTFHEQPRVLAHFAHLAYNIGFRSFTIEHIIRNAVQITAVDTKERNNSRRRAPSKPEDYNALGKPCALLVSETRHMLFLPTFHSDVIGTSKVSHFFVQRSLYLDIFDCENAADIHKLLSSTLYGLDYSIPEVGNQMGHDSSDMATNQGPLVEPSEVSRRLQGDVDSLEAGSDALRCELLKLRARLQAAENENKELQDRSTASLIQAQRAEADRSVARRELAKERHRQRLELESRTLPRQFNEQSKNTELLNASAYADAVETIKLQGLYQVGERVSIDGQEESMPYREHMVWSPSIRTTGDLNHRPQTLTLYSEV